MDSKNKTLAVVAVVALAAAGGIYWMFGRGTADGGPATTDAPATAMITVKCKNPDCGNEWEMPYADYRKIIENHEQPECPKCHNKAWGVPAFNKAQPPQVPEDMANEAKDGRKERGELPTPGQEPVKVRKPVAKAQPRP